MTSDELRARLLMIGLLNKCAAGGAGVGKCKWAIHGVQAGNMSLPRVYYYPRGHPQHHLKYSVHLTHEYHRTETNDPEVVWEQVIAEILKRQ